MAMNGIGTLFGNPSLYKQLGIISMHCQLSKEVRHIKVCIKIMLASAQTIGKKTKDSDSPKMKYLYIWHSVSWKKETDERVHLYKTNRIQSVLRYKLNKNW